MKLLNNTYSLRDLDIRKDQTIALEKLFDYKSWIDLIILYTSTIFIIFLTIICVNKVSVLLYPLLVFFIAGRVGAFVQLVHEASHNLISKNKKINNFFGSWLTGCVVGLDFFEYQNKHLRHHRYVGTSSEPSSDSEKYSIVDFKNPKLYFLFLKDLIGINAFKIFLGVEKNIPENNFLGKKKKPNHTLFFLLKLSFVQFLILSLFRFDMLNYLIFWLWPILGPHMVLMRIRGIAEHGLANKLKKKIINPTEGKIFTRTFLTNKNSYKLKLINFFEKILIGSFNVYYHHEHHLNQNIPHYNLKKFHNLVYPKLKNLIEEKLIFSIYEKGYFSAALSKDNDS